MEFLKPEVINNLTEFQIAQIACFPGVQEKLIKLNSSKSNSNKKLSSNFIEINSELDLITKILAQYQNNTKEQGIGDEDWRSVLDALLLYADDYNESDEYDETDEYYESEEYDEPDEYYDSEEYDESDEYYDSEEYDESDEYYNGIAAEDDEPYG